MGTKTEKSAPKGKEVCQDVVSGQKSESFWETNAWWLTFGSILVLNIVTRFYNVHLPKWVCWDETHFGKMGSWYINQTFFFDVHPPLGKMLIAGVGYVTGYNGTHPFEKPGDDYGDHNYVGMRAACTALGACLVPFTYLTVWDLTKSVTASSLSAVLLVFDVGMLTLNRYILLDPPLLFFISGSTFALFRFRTFKDAPFTFAWWFWLAATGFMIACAFSVKFVGLFVVLFVGLNTVEQLWDIMGDMSRPLMDTVKHFMARAVCLIALPISLYIFYFWIHLTVLYKSGNGDGHFSSYFQSALVGNSLNNASMPRDLAFGAVITLRSHHAGSGYLHSHNHLYPEGIGSKQQQVTAYAHKDENNRFLVKRWNSEGRSELDFLDEKKMNESMEIELVRHGDLIRLEHVTTRRNVHAHSEKAPLSKKQFQVTGYGENGTGDANDVWRVEIEGGRDGDVVETLTSKIRLHHYFLKCVLTTSTKQLPKWGFEQQEVTCNPNIRDPIARWNVEDNHFPRLPSVSFDEFAPNFVQRFVESHIVMLTGNAGLKPKEGEYTSRPWEWPINIRGQYFSGKDHRVYLLGNPVIWWGNIGFLLLFGITYMWNLVREQRGHVDSDPTIRERKARSLYGGAWLAVGWALHYVPFWMMGRVLYFHHYFPALLYSCMITGVVVDYALASFNESVVSKRVASTVFHTFIGLFVGILAYSFVLFSPLAYGIKDETPGHLSNSSVHHIKWLESWEF